jgi:hypothetical protein
MKSKFLNNKKNNIYLTNFLPLVVNNFLKKGEKEKTFIRVNKVLQQFKKVAILNDCFFVNKYIFINKIFYFTLLKMNENFSTKKQRLKNNFNFLFLFKKTRENQDFVNNARIFFHFSNLYSNDFYAYQRINEKIEFQKNYLLKKKKIKFKILVKKIILNLIYYFIKNSKINLLLEVKKKLYVTNYSSNIFFYDFKFLINNLLKKIFILKYYFNIKIIKNNINYHLKKNKIYIKLKFLHKFLKKKNSINNKKNYIKKSRKYYYINKKIRLLKNKYNKLNKKYFLYKKTQRRLNRFEYKKRNYLFKKLKKAFVESRRSFFNFKRKFFFMKEKKMKKEKKQNELLTNYGYNFGLKLFVIKKKINRKKDLNKRNLFFKYSIFPVLFSSIKFLNVVLSKYRIYFTFREQRLWGKYQMIPNILNLKRDVRITTRNFKKSLQDVKFENVNFLNSFFENLLYAGSKKGFLLKVKQQAYIFMLKNTIFLQFMIRKRKNISRRRRRKKIDRK